MGEYRHNTRNDKCLYTKETNCSGNIGKCLVITEGLLRRTSWTYVGVEAGRRSLKLGTSQKVPAALMGLARLERESSQVGFSVAMVW